MEFRLRIILRIELIIITRLDIKSGIHSEIRLRIGFKMRLEIILEIESCIRLELR